MYGTIITSFFVVQLPTLDFGDPLGDNFGPYGPEAVSNAISLQGEYIFYGREEDTLFVSGNTQSPQLQCPCRHMITD